jgi:aryl-alcohol dehydrogenase-like predicted oxidoreductase
VRTLVKRALRSRIANLGERILEMRKLGHSGLTIAPIVFGGNVFGWTADEATSFKLLDAFVDAGFNCVDTADVYSRWHTGNTGGESETIIGKWFARAKKRDKVVLATKIGMDMGSDKKGLAKKYILAGVEDSLKRLQTDRIDLYQSHRDDPETPIEETLSAYDQLIKQGKVRFIGASNYSAERLKASLDTAGSKALPRYATLQPNYSLMERAEFEAGPQGLCVKEGISVIPYYSLASGFLTGKYRSEADLGKSARGGRVKGYLNARGMAVLAALDDASKRLGATQAQVALAWLMQRPSVAAPIVSATSTTQLAEILKAASVKLDAAAITALDKASGS